MQLAAVVVISLLGVCAVWGEEAAKFAAGPTVKRVGEGFEISFELSRATDATVRVIDAEGKIVRHLASGMLGTRLYDLVADPVERKNIAREHPDIVKKMRAHLEAWQASVERSLSGQDYPGGLKK